MGLKEDILGRESQLIIGNVQADGSIREGHERSGSLTTHPVEDGSQVNDHYILDPKTFIVEGVITNTPLANGFPTQTAINSVKSLVTGDSEPVIDAWGELNRYFDDKEVIVVQTSLQTYPNVVLTSLSVERTAQKGDSLHFSCTFNEIRFVKTLEAAAIIIPDSPVVEERKDEGKQTNKAANKEQEESVGFQILKAVTSYGS